MQRGEKMDVKFNSAEEAKRFWKTIKEDRRKRITALVMTAWATLSFVTVFVSMGDSGVSLWMKLALIATLVFIGFSGFLYALSPWAAER